MGTKKKARGSKLAKMSDEERSRYLQHRAAIEEETRRRKEQLIATFMKNKLKREEAFSRLNVAKINQQWRQTLRQYKCIELRQDLEALFKWFVHTASKKTKQIDVLLDDLDEAECQYGRIHRCHVETIERLIEMMTGTIPDDPKPRPILSLESIRLHGFVNFAYPNTKLFFGNNEKVEVPRTPGNALYENDPVYEPPTFPDVHERRINFFHRHFEEDRKEIYEAATNEMESIISSSICDHNHLRAISYRMEEFHRNKVDNMESKHTVKADELRNNMLTELENLTVAREAKIEKIWQQIQKILKDYWDATEDRRRLYVTLRDADIENCKQIFFSYQQINNFTDVMIGLKDQMLRTTVNSEERFAEAHKEREKLKELFQVLRKQLAADQEKDKKNLAYLTVVADETTKQLQRIQQKGEQILQALALCKKMEVLRDKISPYGTSRSCLTEEQEKTIRMECSNYREKLTEEVATTFLKLDCFWMRYNKVLIEKETLALNIKSLKLEQTQLKHSLKNYLSDVMMTKPTSKVTLMIHRPYI